MQLYCAIRGNVFFVMPTICLAGDDKHHRAEICWLTFAIGVAVPYGKQQADIQP